LPQPGFTVVAFEGQRLEHGHAILARRNPCRGVAQLVAFGMAERVRAVELVVDERPAMEALETDGQVRHVRPGVTVPIGEAGTRFERRDAQMAARGV
jgi:hypothetical protein